MKYFKYLFQFLFTIGIFFSSVMLFPQNIKHKEYDSILLNKPREMGNNNIPVEKIILWNKKMLEKVKKEDYKKGIIWVYTSLADEYLDVGKSDEAVKYLNTAKKLSDKYSTDNFTVGSIYQVYSRMYYELNLNDIALKHNSKAIYYGKNIENSYEKKKFLQYAYAIRGTLYYNVENKDSAIIYIKKANQIDESPGILSTIANHYLDYSPNQDSARKYLNKAVQVIKKNGKKIDSHQISVTYYYYGIYFMREKDYANAVLYLEKSLLYNKTENNKDLLQDIYKNLALCYKGLGDKNKENESLENLIRITDTISGLNTKTAEISIKNIEEEKIEEKKTLKKTILIYSSIVSSLSLVLFIYLYYQNKRKKKLILESKEIISQKESETLKLKSRIVDAHEEIMQLAKTNDIGFLAKFQEVYPNVSQKLLEINPALTKDNLIFCALIWLGFSSKDIAEFTFMQHRSVQIKKGRLRKKLNLGSDVDLYQYIKSLVNN
ncbi:hypothetical protein EG346_21905 [Chryseobacterium carnipullorum]|uniref:HTH luxR-type domain-containing protein n=3 Tax=Chryseobacterium carnipullorum TaxID=1124835 RepID=A0A3G6NKM4_CHRCU|nr:LuxR C-terminal-related transcriptional regulator [Chryseobacterium carnipullorum]AZA50666.1 hypothetical protein EG346_21905 [Chryseobacterium carnipullorum]AZA65533.1 hypothetical protein EG345_12995 [Chryseobacterium carnipullorum]